MSITDREYFTALYGRTKESVHRYIAAKCFSLDDIDDIYQNVWLNVFEAIAKKDSAPPNEDAFVMLIAKRQLGRYYSLAAKLKNLVSFDAVPGVPAEIPDLTDVEDELIGRELLSEIGALLRRKSLTSQKIFYLYFTKAMSTGEIAGALGVKETTVKKHLYSVLADIRRLYERRKKL